MPPSKQWIRRSVMVAGVSLSTLCGTFLLRDAWAQTAESANVAPLDDASGVAIDATANVSVATDAVAAEQDAGSLSIADAAAEELTAAEEAQAERVTASDRNETPDPVTTEPERLTSAEGEALSGNPAVANEIAALSDRACVRALQRAHVPYERARHHTGGMGYAIRVTGPIEGVRYRSSERREINELMDCRLALALVRFSRLIKALDVTEVIHYSTYRPASHEQVERQPLQTRHAGGLAIDAAVFVRSDGHRYSVLGDFRGTEIGDPVCGPDARVLRDVGARFLRSIACDAARRGLFHVVLTPHYNQEHRNHFHLEVTRGVHWQYVH